MFSTSPTAESFDVVIVGARCAGSPLAILLARSGMRVCLVDKARFPSDTPSTHGIQPVGVQVLTDLGLRDRLDGVAASIEHASLAFEDERLDVAGITARVGAPMMNIRRISLDEILVDAAAEAGADVRTSTAVTGLLVEEGRVVGVRTQGGMLRAPLVVGADGVRSSVARFAGALEYHRIPGGRLFLWSYLEGAETDQDRVWLGSIGDHGYLASQTDAGLFMVAVVPSVERFDDARRDREGVFDRGLAGWPELEAAVAGARRVGPVRMMSRLDGYLRQSAGPGWVLVGDAGHFKDPSPGQGIADALRQAVALASAIERAHGGAQDPDAVLRDWWAWRDRDAWEMYRFAAEMGAAGPTPDLLQEVQSRITEDAELTDALLRVLNHELAPSEVFTPWVAARALATGLRRRPGRRAALLREARRQVGRQVRGRRPPAIPA